MLSEKALSALRTLNEVLGDDHHPFVLIGATAPQILIDLRQGGHSGSRPTRDLDVSVKVHNWRDFERIINRLQERGFVAGPAPNQLTFEEEVRVDLLPYGAEIVENDQITWPDTQQSISVVGMEEVFQNADAIEIAPELLIPVATISALVLLKIAAYTDRPLERARDLVDITYCLERYEEEGQRRFELAGELVEGKTLTYQEAGALLLGGDVARIAKQNSLLRVRQFVLQFDSEYSQPISQIIAEERRLDDSQRRSFLFRLFAVFGYGVTR